MRTRMVSKVLRLPRKMKVIVWKPCQSIAPITQNEFRHVCRHMWMSRSATPATQHDITTFFESSKMRGFAASPIDTAMPQENQRIEMRHVGASKQAFRATLQIFTLCNYPKDHTSKLMFRAWLLLISSTCHKRPRLPRNFDFARCHHVTQPGQCDSQKKKARRHV